MSELDPFETWTDAERRRAQWERLSGKLPELRQRNPFYRAKLPERASRLAELPFTTKTELSEDQAARPPFGTNLTYPLERYVRLHQTSGTTGRPLRLLDTAESWEWWRECWQPIYRAAGVTARDRIFFAFSFGPFVGFWSAFAGAERLGAMCLTGGAMSTIERVASIVATEATVLMCTPTYALRLAEAAREEGIDLARSALRVSIHAGEPGASIPATRERIEKELGVETFDHTGATEVGAYGFSCAARDGVHINESEFIVEVLDAAGHARDEGEGELVLTNLGRWGMPVIRYRTGDRVHAVRGTCACGRTLVKLVGGIAGRVDDMLTVRGVNVFPSAIEAIVRRFAEIEEYRVEVVTVREMEELRCIVETRGGGTDLAERVATAIHRELGIRCTVEAVAPGSLPRFDMKAK